MFHVTWVPQEQGAGLKAKGSLEGALVPGGFKPCIWTSLLISL